MPNTVRKTGKNDIAFLTDALQNPNAAKLIDLLVIDSERKYNRALTVMRYLVMKTPDTKRNPFNNYMVALADAIARYESENHPFGEASPVDVLKSLMEEHGLSQTDLSKELGGQSIVSQILRGKRELNRRQIEALSKRFHLPPSVFF